MIKGFAILLVCLLAGDGIVHVYRLPVPGSICGMALLFGWLLWRGEPASDDLGKAADGLLANLGLLFVPAGVGSMATWHLVSQDWLIIAAAIVVSTVVAIAVTAVVAIRVAAQRAKSEQQ